MEIWVLGTLEISHEGRAGEVHGALPRRLLALLTLTPGREVDTDVLVDGLWGEQSTSGALATLQSHVARLRRDLPAANAIRTGRHGYLLDLDPADIDALAFEREIATGTELLVAGQHERASATLVDALGRWRGTPYAEFPDCEPLEAEAQRLAALRLDALERRIAADLGRPGVPPPIAELESLVRWHPLRESFWGLLMAAQYRAGRQGDALTSYRRARTTLVDQLGVEPGPSLRDLEQLILAQDPALDGSGLSPFLPTPHVTAAYPDAVTLVERADLLETLSEWHDEAAAGSGRLVLVHGEAGVGKSALVRAWCSTVGSARVLWGACDPLTSPRPLGPLVDVAPALGPVIGDLLRGGERDGLFEATIAALAAEPGTVLVIEDLHWADMSTLDLVRFLARRLESTGVTAVATYRDDGLEPSDPVRVMLGDIASQSVVRRLAVPLLTREAVIELATASGLDPVALFRETGGNAFFVTEVIASGGEQLPGTVQDAVLARVHRLSSPARLALESAAVLGSRIEPSLIHGMPDVTLDSVDECVTSGMLRFQAPSYAFRHELVRQAVLSGVAPGRLGVLHWQALERLRTLPIVPKPFARLAEHAEMAGDPPAIVEFAVAAGDAAASLGSHREAAYQYGRALPYADLLDLEARIALLGSRARECTIADQHDEAISAWRAQMDLLRLAGRDLDVVEPLLGLEGCYYTVGDARHGADLVDEALALLEGSGRAAHLAQALDRRAAHLARRSEFALAVPQYEEALDAARAAGALDVTALATAGLGFCHFQLGDHARGRAEAEEALRFAAEHDLVETTAQVIQTAAYLDWLALDYDEGLVTLEDAARYTADNDLHGDLLCVLASTITLKLDMGRWDEALKESDDLLHVRKTGRASRIEPLMAIGAIGARRGDRDDVWTILDEALALVAHSPTLDYQGFVALVRAEVLMLEGRLDAARAEVAPWLPEAIRTRDSEWLPRYALLCWRLGMLDAAPEGLREPEASSLAGRHRDAFDFWVRTGAPYQAAWALLDSGAEIDIREARALFDRLGAAVLVRRCDDALRAVGARVPRGARPTTRANLGGLTDRETDVLDLLDEGLRNADIAARLHLSEKTVANHVSAILAKLGASSRTEAVRRARDLAAAG